MSQPIRRRSAPAPASTAPVLSGRFTAWGTFPSGVISCIYHQGTGTLEEIEAELLKKAGAPPVLRTIIQYTAQGKILLRGDAGNPFLTNQSVIKPTKPTTRTRR